MKICVTGASGFIGKKLVKRLLATGHEVHALSRNSSLAGAKTFQIDLLASQSNFQNFFEGAGALFHCAGELNDKSLMHSLHVGGTRKLLDGLEISLKAMPRPFHWIQLSSVGAYGPPAKANETREINETSAENPAGEYEVSKTLSDLEVKNRALRTKLFNYTLIRPTIVFSEDMPNKSVFSLVKMVRKGIFFYIGYKNTIANYIHAEDVVEAMLLTLNHPQARNETFIISNDCELESIVKRISQLRGGTGRFLRFPEGFIRPLVSLSGKWISLPITQERIDALVRRTHYSNSHIEQLLGFKPMRDPAEYISKL